MAKFDVFKGQFLKKNFRGANRTSELHFPKKSFTSPDGNPVN